MAQKSSKLVSTKEDECIMLRKCGRAVEGVGLENQSGESHRGFESLRFLQRGRSSEVERLVYTQDVVGSIPAVPTRKKS